MSTTRPRTRQHAPAGLAQSRAVDKGRLSLADRDAAWARLSFHGGLPSAADSTTRYCDQQHVQFRSVGLSGAPTVSLEGANLQAVAPTRDENADSVTAGSAVTDAASTDSTVT